MHGYWASQLVLVVKSLPAKAGDMRDTGLVAGLGRFPGGGNSNPLQYSCLENPMNRGARKVAVHMVTKSQTRLKQVSMHGYWKLEFKHSFWGNKIQLTIFHKMLILFDENYVNGN